MYFLRFKSQEASGVWSRSDPSDSPALKTKVRQSCNNYVNALLREKKKLSTVILIFDMVNGNF